MSDHELTNEKLADRLMEMRDQQHWPLTSTVARTWFNEAIVRLRAAATRDDGNQPLKVCPAHAHVHSYGDCAICEIIELKRQLAAATREPRVSEASLQMLRDIIEEEFVDGSDPDNRACAHEILDTLAALSPLDTQEGGK